MQFRFLFSSFCFTAKPKELPSEDSLKVSNYVSLLRGKSNRLQAPGFHSQTFSPLVHPASLSPLSFLYFFTFFFYRALYSQGYIKRLLKIENRYAAFPLQILIDRSIRRSNSRVVYM